MSADRLLNALKLYSAAQDATHPQPCWGVVTSVNPTQARVRVQIGGDGAITGWLPIGQAMAGNGWTFFAVPVQGDMALLVPESGGSGDYVATAFAHNDGAPVPAAAAAIGGSASASVSGEIIAVSKAGAVFRLCADGSIYVKAAHINLDGAVTVSGLLTVQNAITAIDDITAGYGGSDQVGLQTHDHSGVQPGASNTGPPVAGS